MDKILGGIYCGSVQPIVDHTPLMAQYNITHILSVLKFNVIPEYLVRKSYTMKNVPIDDDETTDILQYINECNTFIDRCLFPDEIEYDPKKVDFKKIKQKSAIFIHCQAGVSRSVTIVVAYLMYRFGLSLKQALYAVKRKRSSAQPNESFMRQLAIFELMGGQYVDDKNLEYKQWKLENSIKLDPQTGAQNLLQNDETIFQETPIDEDIENNTKLQENMSQEELAKISVIKCKKCRQKLALSTSFIKHEPPSRESSEGHFIRRAAGSHRIIGIQQSQDQCSHFFVEPLNWMKEELLGNQDLEGKFKCPHCDFKVGGYNWKGSRCSCGKWMIPAIHLQVAKVDQEPLQKKKLVNMVKF
ncbi:tyrosine protein phosphatase yvh1 [Hanseniaspora osmophila]